MLVGNAINMRTKLPEISNSFLVREHDLQHRANILNNGGDTLGCKQLPQPRTKRLANMP